MTVLRETSFSEVFASALRGHPCEVLGLHETARPLPVADWGSLDDADHALVGLCAGATLDIGCGPGRLAAALAAAGRVVLGIDVVPEAVEQTRRRGAPALHRDVFDPLPGEGRWDTALLADGNIGIGGDPVALLSRVRDLLVAGGRVVVEVEEPGVRGRVVEARLRSREAVSRPFRWAVVGTDELPGLAAATGLALIRALDLGGRHVGVLEVR